MNETLAFFCMFLDDLGNELPQLLFRIVSISSLFLKKNLLGKVFLVSSFSFMRLNISSMLPWPEMCLFLKIVKKIADSPMGIALYMGKKKILLLL